MTLEKLPSVSFNQEDIELNEEFNNRLTEEYPFAFEIVELPSEEEVALFRGNEDIYIKKGFDLFSLWHRTEGCLSHINLYGNDNLDNMVNIFEKHPCIVLTNDGALIYPHNTPKKLFKPAEIQETLDLARTMKDLNPTADIHKINHSYPSGGSSLVEYHIHSLRATTDSKRKKLLNIFSQFNYYNKKVLDIQAYKQKQMEKNNKRKPLRKIFGELF
ncbi:MAG TPA: hypothetical protein VJY47_02335 [Candidatus Dojkabacteria bacterium]|nr:hypothetical protein [Candidatus Dojkabacteria bacterium]